MTTSLDKGLRSLDVADDMLDAEQQAGAAALLERIVATPVPTDRDYRAAPIVRRRFSRTVISLTAGAAAIAAGCVFLPGLGQSGAAYASWTPTPSKVTAHDLNVVTQACRDQLTRSGGAVDVNMATIPVQLAERRGNFVAVLFGQQNPDTSASCVAMNSPGSTDVEGVSNAVGGSSGPDVTPPPGRITQGSVSQLTDPFTASFTDGAVGAGVTGVTISAGDRTVTATVKNGHYVAWWPGTAFSDGPLQPSGRGGPKLILTYDVTLANGTTRTSVRPFMPR